jgi:hypothetical protein
MPQLSSSVAGPAPDTTAAGSRTAGATGPGVPLGIWPGLPAPDGAQDRWPRRAEATTAAARRIIDASRPADLVATAAGCLPTVIEAAAAAGRRVLGPGPALRRRGDPAALPPSDDPRCIGVVSDAVVKDGEPA